MAFHEQHQECIELLVAVNYTEKIARISLRKHLFT